MYDSAKILQTASVAGELLLQNGAEIFRVQETMLHILKAYDVDDANVFVLSNGIFASICEGTERAQSIVRNVPLGSVNLSRIDEINSLSRNIAEHKIDPQEALDALQAIKKKTYAKKIVHILFCGIATSAFACLFGGGLAEWLCAFVAGTLLQCYQFFVARHSMRFGNCFIGGALATLVACVCQLIYPALQVNPVIIGSIMPLVPGFAFTSGLREAIGGDYLCGLIHILDAILTGVCIALGVYGAMSVFSLLGGVVL
ncbi:MAG: threonine/serine exporter family protein [Clostridia bacterium]|nr:threonine/serine exporter family protein [Clostridia bacterium]